MFNKIYDKIKKFLKENILYIGILVFVYTVCNIELPYYIDAPGSVIDVSERIQIENSYESTGNMYMASVTEIKGIIPTLLWALVDNKMDIVKKEEKLYNNETYEEANIRNHIMLDDSTNNAKVVAFSHAGKDYKISNAKLYVVYIMENAETELKIGDEVISINGKKVNKVDDIKEVVKNTEVGESISIVVKRDDKEITTTSKVYLEDNQKYIGVSSLLDYTVETAPEVKFTFEKSESGPSGGLMLSLAIYNSLVEEDITKGRTIVGTGTIDMDGNVGAIGGIKYKLAAAVKAKADLFLVPKDNYEEATAIIEEYNYDIELVEVSTFKEALDKLNRS